MRRTPDQIRDHAVKCFNQVAPPKYDDGQARKEITSNLDQHPDLVGALREELIDGWFYLHSLAQQIDEKDSKIAELEFQLKRYKEMVKR